MSFKTAHLAGVTFYSLRFRCLHVAAVLISVWSYCQNFSLRCFTIYRLISLDFKSFSIYRQEYSALTRTLRPSVNLKYSSKCSLVNHWSFPIQALRQMKLQYSHVNLSIIKMYNTIDNWSRTQVDRETSIHKVVKEPSRYQHTRVVVHEPSVDLQ